MSDRQYAEKRIKEALQKAGGNTTHARQHIIAWAQEDAKLLQALTKPHLSGIVAYNIDRILSGRGAATTDGPAKKKTAAKPQQKKENFGLEILKAAAGNNETTFGMEAYGPSNRPKSQVSQAHIDAIRAMTRGRKL